MSTVIFFFYEVGQLRSKLKQFFSKSIFYRDVWVSSDWIMIYDLIINYQNY